MKNNKEKGFTLIELLVVISIISLLSSIVMSSLTSARTKAYDSRRKQDMIQLRNALQLYSVDNNGKFPATSGWRGAVSYGGFGTGPTGYIPGLVPKYISALPIDPEKKLDGYLYLSNGNEYKLLSHVSPNTYPPAGQTFYDPARPTWAWMICSGEPACSTW